METAISPGDARMDRRSRPSHRRLSGEGVYRGTYGLRHRYGAMHIAITLSQPLPVPARLDRHDALALIDDAGVCSSGLVAEEKALLCSQRRKVVGLGSTRASGSGAHREPPSTARQKGEERAGLAT